MKCTTSSSTSFGTIARASWCLGSALVEGRVTSKVLERGTGHYAAGNVVPARERSLWDSQCPQAYPKLGFLIRAKHTFPKCANSGAHQVAAAKARSAGSGTPHTKLGR